jgi:hypothetical protein
VTVAVACLAFVMLDHPLVRVFNSSYLLFYPNLTEEG